jgi:RimJ/RimL family protein N-acetyltransferase
MVIGDRNQGIGTQALKLLIDKLKYSYNTVYCIIQRKNIASLKILKRNKFQVENLENDTIRLSRNL